MNIRRAVIAATAAIGLATGTAACGDVIGEKKTGQEVQTDQEFTAEESPPEEGTDGSAEEDEAAEAEKKMDEAIEDASKAAEASDDGDVKIKSCRIGDPYGLGDRMIVVDIEVKNSAHWVADYLYEIEATDTNGDRIEMILGSATKVSPNQTVNTGSGDGEEDASGLKDDVAGLAKCQLISVDRSPSTE